MIVQDAKLSAYRAFRQAGECDQPEAPLQRNAGTARSRESRRLVARDSLSAPRRPLVPYQRCRCGICNECRENARWDRIFEEKFETKGSREMRGVFQCALSDL